jgi:hypothetical protein
MKLALITLRDSCGRWGEQRQGVEAVKAVKAVEISFLTS